MNTAVSNYDAIATEVSPIWRFADRDASTSLLIANGGEGNTFVDYQNIKINILDYLGNVLYNALKIYEDIIAPLRPYITFLTTPIPGTTAFTSGGLTIGALLGSQFETFISDVQEIDNLISPLAILASEDTNGSGWVPATATSIDLSALFDGAEYLGGKIADKISEKVKEKYDEYNKKSNAEDEEENNSEKSGVSEDTSTSAEEEHASSAESDVEETSSDSTSKSFSKSSSDESDKDDSDKESDGEEEKKPSNFSAGLSGGDILLDALDYNTLTNVFQGINTNLLRIQLPELSVSYTFEKKIPIEAFPPLVITLSFTIGFDVNINFGWDTQGFFFNTVDLTTGAPLPLFDFSGKFAIGVGLDFGLIDAEADLYFLTTVSFFWNDVSGTGKVHESDLQYLTSHGDSVFAVEVTGTVGFDFSIVLSIPIPLIGPLNITIFSYSWSDTLFDETFGKVTGQIQLGTVMAGSNGQNDVLLLNSGIYAAQRLFIDTNPVNEVFSLYDVSASSLGENILVVFDNEYYEEFYNIKQVIGYTGSGASQIEAGGTLDVGSGLTVTLITTTTNPTTATFTSNLGPLQYAVVDFFGGNGDTVLQAGASYNADWGRSRLQGGTGTGTELLEANATSSTSYNTSIGIEGVGVDLIGGGGPANIYGSLSGGDNIVAGQGPDIIYGTTNDNIFFETGFGNDRIYVTGGNNSVSFDGWSLDTVTSLPMGVTAGTSNGVTTALDPILTATELGEFITAFNVAPISTPLTLSFGPLVESAVSGNSTVFFATDPAEIQQIDNWTGGIGGDTYNVYYFAPDQTLTLNAPDIAHNVNIFNIFFGNPNIVYRFPGNNGTINLNDTNAQDILDITQVFPETVGTTTLTPG
ncbi:hypothetical protein OAG63_01860, partial [Methylacidiphilales bacterium]|nr:hypothetical protein [Candidatus Methylacidiphilales bacterium]